MTYTVEFTKDEVLYATQVREFDNLADAEELRAWIYRNYAYGRAFTPQIKN